LLLHAQGPEVRCQISYRTLRTRAANVAVGSGAVLQRAQLAAGPIGCGPLLGLVGVGFAGERHKLLSLAFVSADVATRTGAIPNVQVSIIFDKVSCRQTLRTDDDTNRNVLAASTLRACEV
jgi:hypothetical protein